MHIKREKKAGLSFFNIRSITIFKV